MRIGTVCLVWLIASSWWALAVDDDDLLQSSDVVRVGVVAYEAGPGESSPDPRWQALFGTWQAQSGLKFRFAEGTHSDVLHWMHNRVVDVAVNPAGAFVEEQKAEHDAESAGEVADPASVPSAHYEYLATFGYPPAATEFAEDDRRQAGVHWFSRSVCVVSKDSDLDSQEDLLGAVKRGEVHFLMVHPYSASGSMLPRSVLLELLGTEVTPEQVEYTFSHTESLEKLAVSGDGAVAFVHDAAIDDYQVGAVEALEEKLAAMRASIPHLTPEQRASLDIHLVVGTSGGALNALPVAMGVSADRGGAGRIQESVVAGGST